VMLEVAGIKMEQL